MGSSEPHFESFGPCDADRIEDGGPTRDILGLANRCASEERLGQIKAVGDPDLARILDRHVELKAIVALLKRSE